MGIKKVAQTGGKILFYGFTGIAAPGILKTASLLKKEAQKTADSAKRIRDLAGEAREASRIRKEDAKRNDAFKDVVANHAGVSIRRVYLEFLARKRNALLCLVASFILGVPSLVHGHALGLVPLFVGGAMSFEFAWLAEFRLWQLRGRRISKEEHGSLRDFWMEKGAWKGALNPEPGFALNAKQRVYRRWLWLKRFGLITFALGLFCTVDLFFSRSRGDAGFALCCAGLGLVVAMLVEFHLRYLRFLISQKAPVLALFRFESGACYEE
jgi:hypothetical protein